VTLPPPEPGRLRRALRSTNIRIAWQAFFLAAFLLAAWATWTTRLAGYPVSRLLEMDPLVGLATALSTGHLYRHLGWGILVLALTLIFGRAFCNWICPFGTLHQLAGWLFNILSRKERWQSNRYRSIYSWKYPLLVALLLLSALGALQIGLLDPLSLLTRSVATALAPAADLLLDGLSTGLCALGLETPRIEAAKFAPAADRRVFFGAFWIGAILLVLLGMNLAIPRFFCRVLCPLGALLGWLSRFSLMRINRDVSRCTDCNLCLSRCEGAADPQGALRASECFVCMNCVDDCPEDALSFTLFGQDADQVRPLPDVGRRKVVFAGLAALCAAPFLKSHAPRGGRGSAPKLIRPPGSVDERDFLAKCIKCDQCINVCPTNVLQPAGSAESGIEGIWTPLMNFNIGHCQLKCNLCSEVCPTGAIRRISVAEKLGRGAHREQGPIRLGTAFYDLGRCLPHAMEIPCVVCEEVCPVAPKAIQTDDQEIRNIFGEMVVLQKPFIVPELCIGCGICQRECPVTDSPAVYVTAIGETRAAHPGLLAGQRAGTS